MPSVAIESRPVLDWGCMWRRGVTVEMFSIMLVVVITHVLNLSELTKLYT